MLFVLLLAASCSPGSAPPAATDLREGSGIDVRRDRGSRSEDRSTGRTIGYGGAEAVFDVDFGKSSGDLYIAGQASGNFYGSPVRGAFDVFVARLGADLGFRWIRLLGSAEHEEHPDVAVDEGARAVYLVGETRGVVGEGGSHGRIDVFAAKLGTDGALAWARTFGSRRRDRIPTAGGALVAADGDAYVSITSEGKLFGARTVAAGTARTAVVRIDDSTVPGGSAPFALHETLGAARSGRSSAIELSRDENRIGWLRIRSTRTESPSDGTVELLGLEQARSRSWSLGASETEKPADLEFAPDGDVFVAATTQTRGEPTADASIRRYSAGGRLKWTRELTGRGDEFASALAFDERDDRLFLVGTFLQQIEGTPSRGKRDAFVATVDRAGSPPRVRTFGTPEKELGKRLAIPPRTGAPVVCGLTGGDLIGGGHRGYHDGYLLRLPAR